MNILTDIRAQLNTIDDLNNFVICFGKKPEENTIAISLYESDEIKYSFGVASNIVQIFNIAVYSKDYESGYDMALKVLNNMNGNGGFILQNCNSEYLKDEEIYIFNIKIKKV